MAALAVTALNTTPLTDRAGAAGGLLLRGLQPPVPVVFTEVAAAGRTMEAEAVALLQCRQAVKA
jgi:hypothetical protein